MLLLLKLVKLLLSIWCICILSFLGETLENIQIAKELPSNELTTLKFVLLSKRPFVIRGFLDPFIDTKGLNPWKFRYAESSIESLLSFCKVCSSADLHKRGSDVVGNLGNKDVVGHPGNAARQKEILLRKFIHDNNQQCAFTACTKDIASSIPIPPCLQDFDLTLLNWEKTGLIHLKSSYGRRSFIPIDELSSTNVFCSVEGSIDVFLSSSDLLDGISLEEALSDDTSKKSSFDITSLQRAAMSVGDCIYIPKEWHSKFHPGSNVSLISLTWEGYLQLTDDGYDNLMTLSTVSLRKAEEELIGEINEGNHKKIKKEEKKRKTLKDFAPSGMHRKLLWNDKIQFEKFLRNYLLPNEKLDQKSFVGSLKVDRNALPNLVYCDMECEMMMSALFSSLDTNKDLVLSVDDVIHLSRNQLEGLIDDVDELLDELNDHSKDQIKAAIKDPKTKSDLMKRFEERRKSSVMQDVKRLVEGNVSPDEEESIKEKLPGYYEEIIKLRKQKQKDKQQRKGEL